MSKIFTPIGLVVGLAAGQLAKKIFDKVWGLVKDEEAPAAQAPRGPGRRRCSSRCSSRARSPGVVRGMVDHGTRHGWAQLTGAWPGEERPEEELMSAPRRPARLPATQKRSARRPEGPAHARKGVLVQTLKRTMTEFSEDNLTDSAAALTYYAVLSIFPALLAMISIVGLVGDPQTIVKTLTDIVSSIGPASAVDTFKGPIEGLTKSSGTAGIMVIVGIAAALWTASGYVGAFMRASNVIYEVEEGRSFFKLRPLQMLVTLALVVLLALVLVSLVLTGPIAGAVGSAVGLSDAGSRARRSPRRVCRPVPRG